MKLDELLSEYGDSLDTSRPSLPPLEELLQPRPRRRAYGWWAAAAAAAVLLLWSVVPRSGRPLVPVKTTSAAEPMLPASRASVPAPALVARRPAAPVRRIKPKLPMRPRAERPFVALAENSMLPEPAFLQMVRVSVRRERLAELGIATQPATDASALVDADVLLGDDGIARALRLVNSE